MATTKRDPHDVIIGQNLRRLRLARGMSQEILGRGLDVAFQQVQKYEKAINRLSGSRIVQCCKLLKCGPMSCSSGPTSNAPAISAPPMLLVVWAS
jgi:Helix-turn-helix